MKKVCFSRKFNFLSVHFMYVDLKCFSRDMCWVKEDREWPQFGKIRTS